MTYDRWVQRTEGPLLVAALLFLVVLSMPVITPDLRGGAQAAVRALNYTIWAVFAVDYGIRLWLAPDRRRFVRGHIADLLVVVLPFLRPLRLLRLLSVGRILARRGTAIIADVTKFVAGAAVLLVFCGAVLELAAERGARGANIRDFGDAVWWACTTITTVGYGDHYPVTPAGQVVAVILMVAGIALLGIITASIAAWLVHHISREQQIETAVRIEAAELIAIHDRLASIEERIEATR